MQTIDNKGQTLIGFIIVISIVVPILLGGIIYIDKSTEHINTINKLDITCLSMARSKLAIFEDISRLNKAQINILRILTLLDVIKKIPYAYAYAEGMSKALSTVVSFISKINGLMEKFSRLYLLKNLATLNLKNKTIVFPNTDFYDLNLEKISHNKLLEFGISSSVATNNSNLNILVENNDFKDRRTFDCSLSTIKTTTTIKSGSMTDGGFNALLIANIKKE